MHEVVLQCEDIFDWEIASTRKNQWRYAKTYCKDCTLVLTCYQMNLQLRIAAIFNSNCHCISGLIKPIVSNIKHYLIIALNPAKYHFNNVLVKWMYMKNRQLRVVLPIFHLDFEARWSRVYWIESFINQFTRFFIVYCV